MNISLHVDKKVYTILRFVHKKLHDFTELFLVSRAMVTE